VGVTTIECKRIQLRRTKGWRKPERAVVVARPTKWGNPFPVDGSWITWTAVSIGFRADPAGRRRAAVALHRAWLTGEALRLRGFAPIQGVEYVAGSLEFHDGTVVSIADHAAYLAIFGARTSEQPTLPERPALDDLRGRDLACWCPLDQPCHADVLLELANAADRITPKNFRPRRNANPVVTGVEDA